MGLHYTHILQRRLVLALTLKSTVTPVYQSSVCVSRAQAWSESPIAPWAWPALVQLAIGVALHLSGWMLMNTDLYSIPFLLVTNGVTGLMLCLCYLAVDVAKGP